MSNGLLLWVDDEIELLHAHMIFLEKKGYEVVTVSNGTDAIEQCRQKTFDLILLDEMMPGLSGLETLQRIKEISPATPVVMVTKSEEEDIMNQAIGSKIADYLIKPVNPSQILLSLKKNIHRKEIVTEVTQSEYRQNFQNIASQIDNCVTYKDWMDVYRRLVHWELELSSTDSSMTDMLKMQKEEANNGFAKYIKTNYIAWIEAMIAEQGAGAAHAAGIAGRKTGHDINLGRLRASVYGRKAEAEERPMMSTDIFKKKIFPLLDSGEKVFFIVIDNFRYDQWRVLAAEIGDMFDIEENLYISILPTATQYARNAIFSGLMPKKISEVFPELWVDEDEEEGKNINEQPLIQTQIERFRRKDSFSYYKINDSNGVDRYIQHFNQLRNNDFNVLVVNFIDMLSHARTESKMVCELANNESAYRNITLSWFRHSALSDLFKLLSQSGFTVVITTDHGSIRASKPVKIIGDRNTNTNLRYKLGKNLNYNPKEVFVIKDPHKAQLPAPNLSTSYVFATGDAFFAYPNNYNYYVSYYKDTFQHGGVSMEEMLVPIVTLKERKR